jgi:hypothetical protein
MQGTANPRTSVQFRPEPPFDQTLTLSAFLEFLQLSLQKNSQGSSGRACGMPEPAALAALRCMRYRNDQVAVRG